MTYEHSIQSAVYPDILRAIGHTPMVRINRLNPNFKLEMYAKLEGHNPMGSVKDRIALKMIEQAEEEGTLRKGMTILEPTSGNTGIGLSMVGAVKGYEVQIVMSEAVSVERRQTMAALGARLLLTPAALGTDGAIFKAREMVKAEPDKYFMPDQFSNHYNKLAHYHTTAEEIYHQMDGKLDYFVSSLGTSGTLMGVGKYLKEKLPDVQIVCAQPVKGHYIQGLKNMQEAIVPSIYDPTKIDQTVMVDTEEAFAMARRIVREEGIFVGMSSGAALLAAREVARSASGGRMALIFPDRGERYLSTKLFSL